MPERFYLNSHIIGFRQQLELYQLYKTPSCAPRIQGLNWLKKLMVVKKNIWLSFYLLFPPYSLVAYLSQVSDLGENSSCTSSTDAEAWSFTLEFVSRDRSLRTSNLNMDPAFLSPNWYHGIDAMYMICRCFSRISWDFALIGLKWPEMSRVSSVMCWTIDDINKRCS